MQRPRRVGFHVGPVGWSLHSVVVRLDPGGRIGRHPAVVDQALMPLDGGARVAGADEIVRDILPGQIALWQEGEEHETSSQDGLVALVLEGSGLADPFLTPR